MAVSGFMAAVADPGLLERGPALKALWELTGRQPHHAFATGLGALAIIVLVAANALQGLSVFLQTRFVWDEGRRASARLMAACLRMPYSAFLRQDPAVLRKHLLSRTLVDGLLEPVTRIIQQSTLAFVMFSLLVWANPVAALLAAVLLTAAYLVLNLATSHYLRHLSREAAAAHTRIQTSTDQALFLFKSVKVQAAERFMAERYADDVEQVSSMMARGALAGQIPRYLLESAAYTMLILLTVHVLREGQAGPRLLPLLAIYAMAGYRLIPALHAIFSGLTQIRFNRLQVEEMRRLIASGEDLGDPISAVAPWPLQEALELQNVTFDYGGRARPAVQGLSLRIEAGSRVALVGETGAGKTTVVDLLLGLLQPDSGSVMVDGEPLGTSSLAAWQRSLGYVPQNVCLADDTVLHNIAFGVKESEIDLEAARRAARRACLHEFIENELPHGYRSLIGENGIALSGGQRQRLGIARALYHDPSLLILDEATNALDAATEAEVMKSLEAGPHPRTLVIVGHRLADLAGCDRLFVLENGRLLAQGTFPELMATRSL